MQPTTAPAIQTLPSPTQPPETAAKVVIPHPQRSSPHTRPTLISWSCSSSRSRNPRSWWFGWGSTSGGTWSFAAVMKLCNMTVVTMTMSINTSYSEAVALRGWWTWWRAMERWIRVMVMEFLLFDVDRVLRDRGYLWLDRSGHDSICKEKVYDIHLAILSWGIF